MLRSRIIFNRLTVYPGGPGIVAQLVPHLKNRSIKCCGAAALFLIDSLYSVVVLARSISLFHT
jgi:hypothetical protein